MTTLSDKIIQLMAYEAQLETLKKEIVLQHQTLSGSSEQDASEDVLREKIQQYELVSAKYDELFEDILQGSNKMIKEYQDIKKQIYQMNFSG